MGPWCAARLILCNHRDLEEGHCPLGPDEETEAPTSGLVVRKCHLCSRPESVRAEDPDFSWKS